MEGRKFAVLLCADESDYLKKKYGGLHGIFVQMLKEDGQTRDVFKVARGDFPVDGKIGDYDGFVITGSCSDAHGNDFWICKLVVLLKKLDAMKKKVLGICFGHQVLELPPKAEVLARSSRTGIEMFRYGDHIIGIQGHAEYTKDILLHQIDQRLLKYNLVEESLVRDVRSKLEETLRQLSQREILIQT